ncbi:MAG: hypothetical protein FWG53_01200, partial [Clostridiales bacterium]|nr:hypothetical protein [Clostridiales bacterium]
TVMQLEGSQLILSEGIALQQIYFTIWQTLFELDMAFATTPLTCSDGSRYSPTTMRWFLFFLKTVLTRLPPLRRS